MRLALRLEAVTIGWMLVEAGVAIAAGVAARSVVLFAFGADSVVELVSATVLYWRLRLEVRSEGSEEVRIAAVERRAGRLAGYLLLALAAYVVIQSALGLAYRNRAETSTLGIALALAAAIGMPFLARAKIRVAAIIGSAALRADAMESMTCGYLSWILLAGLLANALLHWWWLDSAAALVLVPFLIREGREALTGGGCSCA